MKAAEYIQRGIAKSKKRDFDNAIADYQKAIEIEPDSYIAYYQWGDALFSQNNYWDFASFVEEDYNEIYEKFHKVIEITTEIIKDNPNDVNAFLYRGKAKQELRHKRAESIDDFSRIIEIDPFNIEAYTCRAFSRSRIDDYSGAIEDYTKIIDIDGNNDIAYQKRAYNRVDNKDFTGAIEDCLSAVKINPNNYFAYRCHGNAKAMTGFYHEAIEKYTLAIETGNDPYDYFIRAYTKRNINDIDGAIQDYLKAIDK